MIGDLVVTSGKVKYKYKVETNNADDNCILDSSKGYIYVFPQSERYIVTLNYFIEGKLSKNSVISNITTDIIVSNKSVNSEGYLIINGFIKQVITYKNGSDSLIKRLRTNVEFTNKLCKVIGEVPTVTIDSNSIYTSYYFDGNNQVVIVIKAIVNLKYEV